MVKAGSARMRFATESSGVVLWLVGAESTVKPFTYFGRGRGRAHLNTSYVTYAVCL